MDVSKCSSLITLWCDRNQIKNLDVSKNLALKYVDCRFNQLTTLDINNLPVLERVECDDNSISSLTLNNNPALTVVSCVLNKLTFATLPVKQSTWTVYSYNYQEDIIIPKNINIGNTLDLSNQHIGYSTKYQWSIKNGPSLIENTDYSVSAGVTTFLKIPKDSVLCIMTNATFPDLKLETTCTKVLPAPKKTQTISFNPLPAKKVGEGPFTLSANATSTLQIAYTSSDASIASITGNTVTIHKAGTVTITASQAGDINWEAASATQQLTITAAAATKKAQTITFDPIAAKKVGDPSFDLKATATSSLGVTFTSDNSAIASISGTRVTILKAGTVTITASQGGNGDWNAAEPVTQTLTISKKAQTINFEAIPAKKTKEAPFTLKASSTSYLPITFTSSDPLVASINGSTVTILKAGTVTITATQAGNEEWDATTTSQKLTISATTGINDEEEENLSIYPNPVKETLYIKGKGFESINASIFNAMGANVWSGNVTGQSINVSQLPDGIYLLRIGNKNEVNTIRFEKK